MNDQPIMTAIVAGIVGIVTVVGGVVTIANPAALSFGEYIAAVTGVAAACGLTAIGRGVAAHGRAGTEPWADVQAAPEDDPEFASLDVPSPTVGSSE